MQGTLKSLMQGGSAEPQHFFYKDQALNWINPQVKSSSETKSTINFIAERMMLCTTQVPCLGFNAMHNLKAVFFSVRFELHWQLICYDLSRF